MAQSKTKNTTSKDYRKANVPELMAIKIDEIIENNEEWGFRGLDDFVREAIRASIIKYTQILKENPNEGEINVSQKKNNRT